jgi:hypothetical protein
MRINDFNGTGFDSVIEPSMITKIAAENKPEPVTQDKSVTPTTEAIEVEADEGKILGKVIVAGVTAAIDANIIAENIKSGVTILGVEGTYTGE